ncbi:MAG: nitrilase-related carbon-nitrogen hydrolase [Ignavibacteria bacterium]
MKAGYLQFKPKFGDVDFNIKKIKSLIGKNKFDLLVLPELANSGYLFSDKKELAELSEKIPNGNFCKALQEICSKNKCYIVSGICERSGKRFYNSSILVYPDGKIVTYRKIHLFNTEKKWFTPGDIPLRANEIVLKSSEKVKVGMMICFDWIFPETARTLALQGVQILCHPSNLVMQYCQRAMFTRALENHIFTITANRIGKDIKNDGEISFTGQSVIVSPKGEYIHTGSKNKEECVIVNIDPEIASDKFINPDNNLYNDRRKKLYKIH